jgi:hypothetical protein
MTRDDVIRITESVLSELKIEVDEGGFTDPNTRKVNLKFKDKVISTAWFDVVQKREYEG